MTGKSLPHDFKKTQKWSPRLFTWKISNVWWPWQDLWIEILNFLFSFQENSKNRHVLKKKKKICRWWWFPLCSDFSFNTHSNFSLFLLVLPSPQTIGTMLYLGKTSARHFRQPGRGIWKTFTVKDETKWEMVVNGAVNNKHENILGKVKGKMVRYICI